MNNYKYYPSWVYSRNERTTRENMRQYDQKQKEIEKACLQINPNYYKLTLREQYAIRDKVEGGV